MESSVRFTALPWDKSEKNPSAAIPDRNLANSPASNHDLCDLFGSLLQCLQPTGKAWKYRLSSHLTSISLCIGSENWNLQAVLKKMDIKAWSWALILLPQLISKLHDIQGLLSLLSLYVSSAKYLSSFFVLSSFEIRVSIKVCGSAGIVLIYYRAAKHEANTMRFYLAVVFPSGINQVMHFCICFGLRAYIWTLTLQSSGWKIELQGSCCMNFG